MDSTNIIRDRGKNISMLKEKRSIAIWEMDIS
jgi:hypothetical protein